MNRRQFLTTSALAAGSTALRAADGGAAPGGKQISLSLKFGMCRDGATVEEKFSLLQELGYDGVELNSPGGVNKQEALAASRKTGLPIHGVVNSIHWKTRLSDPSAEVREQSLQGLLTALREAHAVHGSSVLLVPGVVDGKTTPQQAWDRSIEQIRRALPLAARLGIHILIENVWNGMFYDPKGDNRQSAAELVRYLDEIDSPWVGSYFDIGNHQKFGQPAEWIRLLGHRIVKLDVKDWGAKTDFCKIGEGDVDWPEVRKAVADINFTGWATAEVGGGNRDRCAKILANMRTHLLGA